MKLRMLSISTPSGGNTGSMTISVSEPDQNVVVDEKSGFWAKQTPRAITGTGEVRRIGECSETVFPGEAFAVIDLDEDAHIDAAAYRLRGMFRNALEMQRLAT